MRRAIGLITATLLSTSVYSQDYYSSSAGQNSQQQSQQGQTPDYQSRQSESGTPSSQSSSVSGYDRDSGLSGGNTLTGQSSGANINEDKTLTTRDSELNTDLNIHAPAAPVRESTTSEGWSGAGTFSGAGPGSVTGSDSSSTSETFDSIPSPTETSQQNFSADGGFNDRDADLSSRGLMPDSDQISVGAPANGETGSGAGDNSSSADAAYGQMLQQRVQSMWGIDVPANPTPRQMMQSPRLFDQSLDQIQGDKLYNGTSQSSQFSGAPASSVSGSVTSHDDDDEFCDPRVGNSAGYEEGWRKDNQSELDGSVRSSGSAIDHDERLSRERDSYRVNRDSQDNYRINRSDSVPSDYGDRPSEDDGHLSGNNAAGSSDTSVTPDD